MFGRTKKSDIEFAEQQLMRRNRVTALNPLKKFPSTNDSLTGAFFGSETGGFQKKVDAKERWLSVDDIRPDFGVKVSDILAFVMRSFYFDCCGKKW